MASKFFFWLAAASVFAGTQGLGMVEAALFCGLFAAIGGRLRVAEERRAQQARDATAGNIATYCPVGEPFFLYLRPFELDRFLRVQNPAWYGAAILPGSYQPREIVFESLLLRAVQRYGELVGLGKPTVDEGAGKVATADETWQTSFTDLSNRALAIVVVPGPRPGISWEIGSLRHRGLLSKCVFVCPGTPEHRDYWVKARAELTQQGLFLPDYTDKLTLLTFDRDGSHVESQPLRSRPVPTIVRTLKSAAATQHLSADEESILTRPDRRRRVQWVAASAVALTVVVWSYWPRPIPGMPTVLSAPAPPTDPMASISATAGSLAASIEDVPPPVEPWPQTRFATAGRLIIVPYPPAAVPQTGVDWQATAAEGHRVRAVFHISSPPIRMEVATLEGAARQAAADAFRRSEFCSANGWLAAGRDTWRETCLQLLPGYPGVPATHGFETVASIHGILLNLSTSSSDKEGFSLAEKTSEWMAKLKVANWQTSKDQAKKSAR